MAITNFTVQYDLLASATDSSDVGVDADIVPLIGSVLFEPVIADDRAVLAPSYTPRPAGFKLRSFTGFIDVDGRLKSARSGAVGVRLWANDPQLDLEELTYKVSFNLTTPVGEPVRVDGGYFEAPSTDVAVNLADVLQSVGSPGVGITKGDKGDQGFSFVGLSAAGDGTSVVGLVESDNGVVPAGNPIPVSLAYNSTVTHAATASTPRPPVNVAVIWIGSVQPTYALDGDVWMDTSGTAPTISTTVLDPINRAVVVDQTLIATGSSPITWTVVSGSLPAGVTLSSTGTLAGLPTTAAAFTFSARATNGFGFATQAFSGTVGAYVNPTIVTTELGGVVSSGQEYTQVLVATGSVPATWSIVSGALPDGLALSATGTISGIPTTAGAYSFTVRAMNAAGYDDQAFTGSVAGTVPTITTTALNSLSQGASFTQTLAVTGTAPFVFSTQSGSIPAGLSLNTSTGVISGTPSGTGAYSVTIRATNSFGFDDQAFTGTIAAGTPVVTTTTLNTIYRAVAFTQTLAFTGATPVTWSVTSGSLPAGITLGASTGVLSGTATTVAAYNFTVTATNSYGTGTKTFTGNVLESSPGITETTLNTLRATQAFSQTLTGTGLTPITWSVTAGTLPAGLTLGSATGVISGTPSTAAAYSFTVRATNSVGSFDRAFTGNVGALGVAFSAAGSYAQSTNTTTYSINGPNAAIGDTVVVWIEFNAGSVPTFSATYDGVAMTAKGSTSLFGTVFGLSCLVLTGVSSAGVKTIAVTSSVSATMRVQSLAYSGVTTAGTLATTGTLSGASLSQTVASTAGNMVTQAFGHYPQNNSGALSAYNRTERRNVSALISIYQVNFIVGDAAGATSIGFTATAAVAGSYVGAALELIA